MTQLKNGTRVVFGQNKGQLKFIQNTYGNIGTNISFSIFLKCSTTKQEKVYVNLANFPRK